MELPNVFSLAGLLLGSLAAPAVRADVSPGREPASIVCEGDLIVDGETVTGVVTGSGERFAGRAVVLTVGTFLGGRILVGSREEPGGRVGDAPSIALADRLRELPFRVARLKTGTPPRLDGRTLNYDAMQEQPGDEPRPVFSFLGRRDQHPQQVSCFVTRTTAPRG